MKQKRVRLLIVEDDTALAALLEEYLSEAGYKIQVCHHGDTAMEVLDHKTFDLVLSDIMLPGADGLTILKKAGGHPERTMVILMTGFSGIEDVLHAVERGAYDFVSKPFQLPEIRVRLDNAASYQQLLRKLQRKNDLSAFPKPARISGHTAARAYDAREK